MVIHVKNENSRSAAFVSSPNEAMAKITPQYFSVSPLRG